MTSKMRKWVHGLVCACLGGGLNAITSGFGSMLVAPEKFNLQEGLGKTLKLMGISFLFGAISHTAAYFKQSPPPEPEDDTQPPFPK